MKQILVIGAGLVAKPAVDYLLNQPDFHVTMADQVIDKARDLIGGRPNCIAVSLDVSDAAALNRAVSAADVVVSLTPWVLHPVIADACLSAGTHLVTASYVKPPMKALHEAAAEKGLIFLNEMGVDPGIDHMAAMKIIHQVRDNGGTIVGFSSYCGGLPAPEHNTNPFGYKFSWSPAGVMQAAGNDGRFLKNGEIVDIPGQELLRHYDLINIPGAGVLEAYTNRDALPYIDLYGINSVRNMFRGTLRNIGSCDTWDRIKRLGLLDQDRDVDTNTTSPAGVLAALVNGSEGSIQDDVAAYLNLPPHDLFIKKLEWLGLFETRPTGMGKVSVFEMLAQVLMEKLVFEPGETDLIVQHHEFEVRTARDETETIRSTLIQRGTPGGDSAMSVTVGLPAAIGAKMVAQGTIPQRGVVIPIFPEIYTPILAELETMGIRFEESVIKG